MRIGCGVTAGEQRGSRAIVKPQEPLVAAALDIAAPCKADAPTSEKSPTNESVVSGLVLEVRTATVAIPAVYGEPIFIQMCVKVKTDRVHPVGPYLQALSVTHSESGWASASTIVELFECIQETVPAGTQCPVHYGAETMSAIREAFSTLTLCFVERATTSICQPLDRAYFRAIKACLRRQFCGVMAKEVLNKVNPNGQLVDKPAMRGNILHLLHAAVQYGHTADRTTTAWKHLLVPDEELPALLAMAREEHTTGSLFQNNGPDLDNATDEDPEGDHLHG